MKIDKINVNIIIYVKRIWFDLFISISWFYGRYDIRR